MIPLANILQPLIDLADSVITFLHDDVGLIWGSRSSGSRSSPGS